MSKFFTEFVFQKPVGEKYRARYHRHFAHPVLHELDMQHEELLAVHPKEWVELIEDICRQK